MFTICFPCFIFAFILVIFVLVIVAGSKRRNRLQEVLNSQAIKRNGTLRNFFGYPRLEFQYNNHGVRVYSQSGGKNSPPYTHVEVFLNLSTDFKMRIYNETMASRIGKKLGMQDIQIYNDEFDSKFMIKGSDEYIVTSILNFDVQNKLIDLRSFRPYVRMDKKKLRISVPRLLMGDYEYDLLIDAALKIVDRIKKSSIY